MMFLNLMLNKILTAAFACSYLVASMALQILWSFGLLCLDLHALKFKRDLHNPLLVSLFVVGDWVSSFHPFALFVFFFFFSICHHYA